MIYEEFMLIGEELFIYNRKDRKLFLQVGPNCLEIKDPGKMSNILTSNAMVISEEQAMRHKKKHTSSLS